MFNRNKQTGPWSCAKCGSRNVVLRDPPCGITLLDKLRDLLGPLGDAPDNPARQWGAKRVVCKDCGHVSYIHVM